MHQAGQLSERYQVLHVLGAGAMGEVLLARDLRLDMDVAIKRIPAHLASEPALAEVLIREARILAKLNDPRIVRIFDLTETDRGLLLIMEYICGPSLQGIFKAKGRLTEPEITAVLRDVTAGLSVAHAGGIIHRDLKPPNILMALAAADRAAFVAHQSIPQNLASMRAKVADFGIAKIIENRNTGSALATAGSPRYMAPEQFRGEPPSAETDVYALGVILYEALAGAVPFPVGEPSYHHLLVTPPLIPHVSEHCNAIIQRAMAKRREDRYPSVDAFQIALEGQPQRLPPIGPPPPLVISGPKPPKPSRDWSLRYVTAVLILVVMLTIAAGVALWRIQKLDQGEEDNTAVSISPPVETPPLAMRPAPYVDSLPAVVAGAKSLLHREPDEIAGPANPHLLWKTRVDMDRSTQASIAGVGGDGTAYLVSDVIAAGGSICAVRDGKPLWAYTGVSRGYDFVMADDGRIWMASEEGPSSHPKFCFNSRGEGGRVSSNLPSPARHMPRFVSSIGQQYGSNGQLHVVGQGYRCTGTDEHSAMDAPTRPGLMGRAWTGGPAWFLPLTYYCSGNSLVIGPTGDAYFLTVDNALYRVGSDGTIRWRMANAPKDVKELYPLAGGDVVVVAEREFTRVHNGAVLWRHTFNYGIKPKIIFDKRETAFVAEEYRTAYRSKESSHVLAISAAGQVLWERAILQSRIESLFLDGQGRVYLVSGVGDETQGHWSVTCLGDS